MKPPTKRQIRKAQAFSRAHIRKNQRRTLQRTAFELSARGHSLRQIARELGVSHQTVSNWLSGAVRRLVS